MVHRSVRNTLGMVLLVHLTCGAAWADAADVELRRQATAAMRKAAGFYRGKVASHGGYVYYYSVDLQRRWGEGAATADQVWVQPPGTPTVGMAYLSAWRATGDRFHLDAAVDAAGALVYGQLRSGGWTNCIDFDPAGQRVAQYRNGRGRGRDNSSLDDGQSQSAMRLLMAVDEALGFKDQRIGASARIALDALLAAQYPNGGFPQVWTGPSARQPVRKASYPAYDWRTEGRIKNYWELYTLNDNLAGHVADTLIDAHRIYGQERFKQALARLGDFLLLAQLPLPQPAWAQQYTFDMHPAWARRFEPPAISAWESQDAMQTLMKVYRHTGDVKYLEPIPRTLAYLRRSLLPDGRLARYYELRTNRPLYMTRAGKDYTLTYDDANLPDHYGWKVPSRLDAIQKQHDDLRRGVRIPPQPAAADLGAEVQRIIGELDGEGRWVSTFAGQPLPGDQTFKPGDRFIGSDVFSQNMESLAQYLLTTVKR